MQLMARALVVALATLVVALALPSAARADGWLSMRGGYYKEKSTRVVQPMLDAQIETSEHGTLDVHALVDSITSASPSTGATGVEFTEERYEGGFVYTHAFGKFRLGGGFTTSTESDYDSNLINVRGELSLFEKNTVLALNLGRHFDKITNGVQGGGLGAQQTEHLQSGLTSLSWTQLITPQLVGNLTWDLIDAHGFQENIYRRVTGGPVAVAERVPDLRLRNAVYVGVRGFFCPTETTVVGGYRFYIDDWGIVAHTLEARVIQEVTPGLEVRGRVRLYKQSAADFYQDTYSAAQTMDESIYVTDDAKLSAMTTYVFGVQAVAALGLFGIEGKWSEVRLDAIVERILQDTYFGDAWSAQVGLVVPVAY
jgi:hypothetical protein